MKQVFFGSIAAAGLALLSGCCGYQGYAIYDDPVVLSKENERVTAEKENLQISDGAVKIEKIVDYSYKANLRIDRKEAYLYTEGSGIQVIGNCIFYPFALVLSPVRLMTMTDETKKELGHEYTYSYGRQVWNMFNPFVCTMGDYKEEVEVLSSKNTSEERTRSERMDIKDGQFQLVYGNQKKDMKAGTGLPEIHQAVFDFPLPEKTSEISLVYHGKPYKFTIKSTDILKAGEPEAWKTILNAKDYAALENGKIMASLNDLYKNKKISEADYKKEQTRLDSIIEVMKFPAKAIADSRIPLTDTLVSGTSFRMVKAGFDSAGQKYSTGEIILSETSDKYDGVYIEPEGGPTLLFAVMGKDLGQAVLVQKAAVMPNGISMQQVLDKIKRGNQNVKTEDFEYKDSRSRGVDDGIEEFLDTATKGIVIKSGTTMWKVYQIKATSRYEGPEFLRKRAGVKNQSTLGPVHVITGDAKLINHFVNVRKQQKAAKIQAEKKAAAEAQSKALNNL